MKFINLVLSNLFQIISGTILLTVFILVLINEQRAGNFHLNSKQAVEFKFPQEFYCSFNIFKQDLGPENTDKASVQIRKYPKGTPKHDDDIGTIQIGHPTVILQSNYFNIKNGNVIQGVDVWYECQLYSLGRLVNFVKNLK